MGRTDSVGQNCGIGKVTPLLHLECARDELIEAIRAAEFFHEPDEQVAEIHRAIRYVAHILRKRREKEEKRAA